MVLVLSLTSSSLPFHSPFLPSFFPFLLPSPSFPALLFLPFSSLSLSSLTLSSSIPSFLLPVFSFSRLPFSFLYLPLLFSFPKEIKILPVYLEYNPRNSGSPKVSNQGLDYRLSSMFPHLYFAVLARSFQSLWKQKMTQAPSERGLKQGSCRLLGMTSVWRSSFWLLSVPVVPSSHLSRSKDSKLSVHNTQWLLTVQQSLCSNAGPCPGHLSPLPWPPSLFLPYSGSCVPGADGNSSTSFVWGEGLPPIRCLSRPVGLQGP